MTAPIRVRPCSPVRDFEHEGWTRLVMYRKGEALALFVSRHVSMHCIESRMVANTAQLPVAKVDACDGSKFIPEMWIGSDEFGLG
eukprot:1153670-Pelagomonas_calceolata.AAC.3